MAWLESWPLDSLTPKSKWNVKERIRVLEWFKVVKVKGASLVTQVVKTPPAMQETWVWSLGWEDPLEKEMATHASILAWRIPWTVESGELQSTGLQGVRHNWETNMTLWWGSNKVWRGHTQRVSTSLFRARCQGRLLWECDVSGEA